MPERGVGRGAEIIPLECTHFKERDKPASGEVRLLVHAIERRIVRKLLPSKRRGFFFPVARP